MGIGIALFPKKERLDGDEEPSCEPEMAAHSGCHMGENTKSPPLFVLIV